MKTLRLGFDHKQPNLSHSSYPLAPFSWVDGIRKSFPHIWNLGTSELSDDSFELWTEVNKGNDTDYTDKWVCRREKYAEQHICDANIFLREKITPRNAYRLVNLLKWGIVPPFGLPKTKELMAELMEADWTRSVIKFERMYEDYPATATENAKRAIAQHDTNAGKRVKNQFAYDIAKTLANKGKLKFSEVQKIASFIRYKNLAGKSYEDNESAIVWDSVGGTNGVMWAKRRCDSMEKMLDFQEVSGLTKADSCSNERCSSCMLHKKGWCEQYDMPTIGDYVCNQWVDAEQEDENEKAPFMGADSKVRKDRYKRELRFVNFNRASGAKARKLISDGLVNDSGDADASYDRNEYIETFGWDEYSKWFLASNQEHVKRSYSRYVYPITKDFVGVSIEAVKEIKHRAALRGHKEIFEECQKILSSIGNPLVKGSEEEDVPTPVITAEEPVERKTLDSVFSCKYMQKKKPTYKEVKNEDGSIGDYQNVKIAGYASTNESVTVADRGGDYIRRGAFKNTIDKFMENPVMLSDHANSTKQIVGKYTRVEEDEKGLYIEGEVSNSPELSNLRFQIVEGNLQTMSIGGLFQYEEDGKAIKEIDLLEISLVAIPMNPDARFEVRSNGEAESEKKV